MSDFFAVRYCMMSHAFGFHEYKTKGKYKMKKIIALLLAVMLVLSLVACASKTEPAEPETSQGDTQSDVPANAEPEEEPADDKVKVMIVAKKMADPFCTWLMNMAEKSFQEDYPEVEYTIVDQAGDPANTEIFLDQALLDGYDAVLLQKVSGSQDTDELFQRFAEQGLRTVIVNNEADDGVTCSAFAPEYEMGKMVAEYACTVLPENAKVCILKSTPSLFSSEQRALGFEDVLAAERPDVEILDTKNVEGWDKALAITVTSDWCQKYEQIDAILSCNDGMVLGAIEACKADGRNVEEMLFFGIDGLADGCLSIEAGEETASVLQDAALMAREGVRLTMEVIADPDMEATKSEIAPILITNENVAEMLQMHRENGVLK